MDKKKQNRNKKSYSFIIGVEGFSRYAFVFLNKKNDFQIDKSPLEDKPPIEKEAIIEQEKILGERYVPNQKITIEAFKNWFKRIDKMGYVLRNVVSDNGTEFTNKDVKDFLKNGADGIFSNQLRKLNDELKKDNKPTLELPLPIYSVLSIPNDRIANPIVESFIKTFKRLMGQYLALSHKNYIDDEMVQEVVNFYNNRIHSSTGYAPIDLLEGDVETRFQNQNSLFDIYTRQKSSMYHQPHFQRPLSHGYCRIYAKWQTIDNNIGDKKSNIKNWSYTIFKIDKFNKKDNSYILSIHLGRESKNSDFTQIKDYRDFNIKDVPKEGLRREFLKIIDLNAFLKYNIEN